MNAKYAAAKVSARAGSAKPVALSLALCAVLVLLYWGIGLGGSNKDGALYPEKTPALIGTPSADTPGRASTAGAPMDAAALERQKRAALLEALGNATQRLIEFSAATEKSMMGLNLETAFTPDALSSEPRLAESFQKIGRLQELQRFAAKTKADYFASVRNTIKNSGLGAQAIDKQMADFDRSLLVTEKMEQEIQSLESQTSKAAVALLEFARAELGKSTPASGQLVFQIPEKNQQFQQLMGDLVKSSSDQNRASVRISELQQKQKYALDRVIAK